MGYILKRRIKYSANSAAQIINVPALFTKSGVLVSHLRFLYANRNKSQSWQERNIFAVELLLKFLNVHEGLSIKATEALHAFVDALVFGTITPDVSDDTGLFWHPRSSIDVNVLLGHINIYCDYLDQVYGNELPTINPLRKATKAEEKLQWCAYYKREASCFLNHLQDISKQEFSLNRTVISPSAPLVYVESVYRFPENHIEPFLQHGFTRYPEQGANTDYASILIVILMHYGGLRISECFHIYVHDVSIDTKTGYALVRVFHPRDGKSPDPLFSNRKEYLEARYRLKPRNEYPRTHRLYSGWKNPLLTSRDLNFEVIFNPLDKALQFTHILQLFLNSRTDGEHPFLFSIPNGNPLAKKNFIAKYNRALHRIGLLPNKDRGTTPHAHRHSYGYGLAKIGLNQFEIQKAMHHKSLESCQVYIRPNDEEVREKLRGEGL